MSFVHTDVRKEQVHKLDRTNFRFVAASLKSDEFQICSRIRVGGRKLRGSLMRMTVTYTSFHLFLNGLSSRFEYYHIAALIGLLCLPCDFASSQPLHFLAKPIYNVVFRLI